MRVLWEKLTAVRLHPNVANGGGADRRAPPQERSQRTAVYESVLWEREDHRTTVPTYRRGGEGGFGRANGVEGDRGVWGILLASWPKGG